MSLEGQGRLVRAYPHVPGVDFAGTVVASDSPEFRPGDPVVLTGWRVGEVQWGGYAERARVKAEHLVRRPAGLSARQAMAIGTAGFTAMLAVIALERHGLDSVMCPREERIAAWQRLARDLPLDRLEQITQSVPLAEVPALAPRILNGEVRGRIVIDLAI